MKFKISSLLILGLFVLGNAASFSGDKEKDWYPFELAEKMDPNSPANIGKLVLDAPAGKHGFVKVKGGDFVFEDGAPARFWGTNLCFQANFPSKEKTKWMADRLAFFGFNAVRLHHMDFAFEPQGIFKDVAPAYKDPQMKETGHLSEQQLDRLDYLIYELKLRGIYININLLVTRNFTERDGVKNAAKLGRGAKPYSLFDTKLIQLQKEYAANLLLHYNPYTKLKYADDPAICMIEITNENSIYYAKGKNLPIAEKDYSEIQKNYIRTMKNYLKNELGVKAPIAGIGGYQKMEDLPTLSESDFVDFHTYWDHPRFPGKPWDRKNFTMHRKSLLQDNKLGIIEVIKRRAPKWEIPYTITEWNHCYPNSYAYETPLLMALNATKEKWDALFQFAFRHGEPDLRKINGIDSYFDIINHPQQLILDSLGSLIYLKNLEVSSNVKNGIFSIQSPSFVAYVGAIKNLPIKLGGLTLTPMENSALVVFTPDQKPFNQTNRWLIANLGEIKNTNSGWNADNKFNWGQAPMLLKNSDVLISSSNKEKFFVYALDESGERINRLSGEFKSPWREIITQ